MTAPDRTRDVANRELGTIERIEANGRMETRWDSGRTFSFEASERRHLDQSPQILKALRDVALVQSAESSNRIEGVTIDPDRLRPPVLGQAKPRDRSEREIFGYTRSISFTQTPRASRSIRARCGSFIERFRKTAVMPAAGRRSRTRSSS